LAAADFGRRREQQIGARRHPVFRIAFRLCLARLAHAVAPFRPPRPIAADYGLTSNG
jgi:hypothetical protein